MASGMSPPRLKQEPQPIALSGEKLRCVFFGEYGVGKTTLALSAPKPLVIDTNGGLISVAVGATGPLGDKWSPDDHTDLEGLAFWLKTNGEQYESYVIDSGDNLVDLLLNEIVDDNVLQRTKNDKDTSLRMSYVPEQGDHFGNQRQMGRFLNELRKHNKHIIITFGVRESDKPPFKRTPDVSPRMRKVVQDWSSLTGELILVDEGEHAGHRALLTAPSPKRESKSRFRSVLPDVVMDPTFDGIWTPIEASYKQSK